MAPLYPPPFVTHTYLLRALPLRSFTALYGVLWSQTTLLDVITSLPRVLSSFCTLYPSRHGYRPLLGSRGPRNFPPSVFSQMHPKNKKRFSNDQNKLTLLVKYEVTELYTR